MEWAQNIPLGSGTRDGHCWYAYMWKPEAQVELGVCPPLGESHTQNILAMYFYIECLSSSCSSTAKAKINRIFRENYNVGLRYSSHYGQEDEKHCRHWTNATLSFFCLPNANPQGKNNFANNKASDGTHQWIPKTFFVISQQRIQQANSQTPIYMTLFIAWQTEMFCLLGSLFLIPRLVHTFKVSVCVWIRL